MSKKILFISAIYIVVVFSLGQNQSALAGDLPTSYPFTPVVTDPLYASASGVYGCPDIETDTAQYQYALPVTPELLGEMQATLGDGGRVKVEFQTVGGIATAGQGEAGYSAQIALAIQHADGSRTTLHDDMEVMPGDNISSLVSNDYSVDISATVVFTDPAAIGDTLLLGGLVEGTANAVSCESGDQAIATWEMMGPDASQPLPALCIQGWDFQNCWPSKK